MTMPKTATVAQMLGRTPSQWTDLELDQALAALRDDLPGDPIGYVMAAIPRSDRCECGALHLSVDAPDLDDQTRSSLHRLLSTPFGDIVREYVRRQAGISTVRFGWSGLSAVVPTFVRVVDIYEVRSVSASKLDNQSLENIIAAIRKDLPGLMAMCDQSLESLTVNAVSPAPGDEGRCEWKALIDQVMVAFSTPVRKYLEEYAARHYNGAMVGAVNCCIVMSAQLPSDVWKTHWFDEQVYQQLTPDC